MSPVEPSGMSSVLIPLLASFLLLVGSTALLATVGRRRQKRSRAIEARTMRAIEGVVGSSLAELVTEAIELRRRLEDAAATGREMLTIERQLGGALRRPLWRQIEDANFGHTLEGVRRAAQGWLARFDGLDATDRQVIELLGLDVAPIRALLDSDRYDFAAPHPELAPLTEPLRALAAPGYAPALDQARGDELAAVLQRSGAAIDCLRRVERELLDYRPSGYR